MADDEKNETTEETVEETVDEAPVVEETAPAAAAEAEVEEEQAPDEQVPGTSTTDEAAEAPEEVPGTATTKPTRSRRHVPRSERRQRPRPKRAPAAKRKPITRIPKPEGDRGQRQERRGVVVSDKGDKTIIVKVDVIKSHPRYKKVVRRSVKFHAHDEQNTAGVGDIVRIVETRPLSKTKRWRLAEVTEKAK
jgi:small subunit ribosomal protein S17